MGVPLRELDTLAVFVHGALAFGHALGLVYNVRRRNGWQSAAHAAALAFDLWACREHMRGARG
jgi:hypothetical protein